MSNPFADFADAASKASVSAPVSMVPDYDRVAVLGGGEDARLIAALCVSTGAAVTLFSAYGAELDAMRSSSGISLRGAGPVGTYQVDRENAPSVQTTAELDAAVVPSSTGWTGMVSRCFRPTRRTRCDGICSASARSSVTDPWHARRQ